MYHEKGSFKKSWANVFWRYPRYSSNQKIYKDELINFSNIKKNVAVIARSNSKRLKKSIFES